jgi:hypothetical protein
MRKLVIILLILIATVTFIRTLGPLNAEERTVRASEKSNNAAVPQP